MVATEHAVEHSSAALNPGRRKSRRKTPQEIEGFENVVLSPGGQVDVKNISNSGILVETGTRTQPGSPVQVRINMAGASHVVKAKVVRSEVATVDAGGIHYELAIAFDETQDLIDWSDAPAVDAPAPSGSEIPSDLLPPDNAPIGLRFACTPNRW
ncbi:MAG: PilZ domain-containing protein [Acidobacteria bacterium]|nr:PilZ domain-containing protein [Acidobacteriota bacterium]